MTDKPTIIGDIMRILFLDCKESSTLMSDSLDRPLRRAEKIALKLHYIGCWSCRRLRKHMLFLQRAAEELNRRDREQTPLSESAAERMKAALSQARDESN